MNTELTKEEIIEAVASKITNEIIGDVINRIESDVRQEVAKKISASASAEVCKFLNAQIEKIWDGKVYQKTDGYGEPKGDPISLSDLMLEKTIGFWGQKVDGNGKPSSGYGSITTAEYLVNKVGAEAFNKAFANHLDTHIKNVVAQYQADSNEYFADILRRAMNKAKEAK